jgi:drug/metabolite transporter (DMT)-like permease
MLADRTSPRLAPSQLALLGLVAVTAAWGSTFFMLKGVLERVPAADFLAVRFALAAAVLALLAPGAMRRLSPAARRHGVLLHMALVAGGLAMVVQTWAQRQLAPTRAAVVMTMEPVWAAGFAVAFAGEVVGPRVLLGGALVLLAMWLVERRPAGAEAPTAATERAPAPTAA